MPARFVNLQCELRRPDDKIESSGRRFRSRQQREGFVANLQSLRGQVKRLDEFPSCSLEIAAKGIRKRAALKLIAVDRQRLDAAAHLGRRLLDVAADGRREDFFLAIRRNVTRRLMNA